MKIRSYQLFKYFMLAIVLAATGVVYTSCESDETTAAAPPVITGVRLTDPEQRDSTFTQAFPGTTIVIQGDNFVNVKAVVLNGFNLTFNPNYVLKNSIIIGIPGNLPVKALYPELPNTIVVVNDKGEASFDFKFLAPAPWIQLVKFQPPAAVGKTITILGGDFYAVEKIQFKVDDDVVAEVTDFTVGEDFDMITFEIPDGGTSDGEIVVVTESGEASTDYLSNPFPEFLFLSDLYQIPGDTLTIEGKYFDFVEKVVFPDGTEVLKEDLKFNALNTKIDLLAPDIAPGSGPVILVTEFGDEIESPIIYNEMSGVFKNWESEGGDWGKGTREQADGTKPPFVGTGNYLHMISPMDANVNWWTDPLVLTVQTSDRPAPAGVTDATPISQIGIAFNYYTGNPWTKGYLAIRFGGHPGSSPHAKVDPNDNIAGKSITRRWQTYVVPLSEIIGGETWGGPVTTWGQFKTATNGFDPFLFAQFFNANSEAQTVNQFWDNMRFVKLQ
ncbi:glycan-binding surface protein [Pseudochryseolinea flava]|nr:glycan-binding surface protein [Pseudochryseolinea flava]